MKKLSSVFIFMILTSFAYSQELYVSEYESKNDIKVYVSDYDDSKVDLKVFKVDYSSDAKGNEGLWFLSDDRYNTDISIHFVDYSWEADLIIHYESSKYHAGWKNEEKASLFE